MSFSFVILGPVLYRSLKAPPPRRPLSRSPARYGSRAGGRWVLLRGRTAFNPFLRPSSSP
eukprot:2521491-Pyramimonas_sp.AAC.1